MNLESVFNFGALQFYLYNMDRQSQMVYLFQVLCSKLCRGVDLSVLVVMPAVVARDHGTGHRD